MQSNTFSFSDGHFTFSCHWIILNERSIWLLSLWSHACKGICEMYSQRLKYFQFKSWGFHLFVHSFDRYLLSANYCKASCSKHSWKGPSLKDSGENIKVKVRGYSAKIKLQVKFLEDRASFMWKRGEESVEVWLGGRLKRRVRLSLTFEEKSELHIWC